MGQLAQQDAVKVLEAEQQNTMDSLNETVDSIAELRTSSSQNLESKQMAGLQTHVEVLEQQLMALKATVLEVLDYVDRDGTATGEANVERIEKSEHDIIKLRQWVGDLQE